MPAGKDRICTWTYAEDLSGEAPGDRQTGKSAPCSPVIVESPTKAKTITRFLGWAMEWNGIMDGMEWNGQME